MLELNSKLEIRPSSIEGQGIFALQAFDKGDRFHVVIGDQPTEIMSDAEFESTSKPSIHGTPSTSATDSIGSAWCNERTIRRTMAITAAIRTQFLLGTSDLLFGVSKSAKRSRSTMHCIPRGAGLWNAVAAQRNALELSAVALTTRDPSGNN